MKLNEYQVDRILNRAIEMAIEEIKGGHPQRYTVESNAREIVNAINYLTNLIEKDNEK